jgi:predicted nucleic acid-binding Zn ribbon protein
MTRPATIADLLSSVFQGQPAGKRLREGKIWTVWESAVGPQIALHARPVAFRDNTLTVAVDSAPWMQQLNFLKKQLVEKLNNRLDEALVAEIYFKAGTVAPPTSAPQPPQKPLKTLSLAEEAHIAALTAPIVDEELRSSLAKLMKSHLRDQQ